MKGSTNKNPLSDSIDDSTSSSSSITSNTAFKRNENKPPNDSKSGNNSSIKQNPAADSKKKTSILDDNVDDFNNVEILKPTKASSNSSGQKSTNPFENDDFFSNVGSASAKTNKSSLSELPPLTGNFQNKFFTTAASKELDKKLNGLLIDI